MKKLIVSLVRPKGVRFEIIAGERRFRAAQHAGIKELPVVVRDADDQTVLELALVENLQRQDLNPIEAALGYQQLVEQYSLTQEQVAVQVGKSRVSVANAVRLLKLTPEIQIHVKEGRISVGHGKVVLGLKTPEEQNLVVEKVIRDNLNVRETEALIQSLQQKGKAGWSKAAGSIEPSGKDSHTLKL
ncbi:ParB/RepB/Spo0J family partition protein, partial [Verrucomicrobia bacterium]|nr:ParB/RepB/Spo0J family partition protein [Verrucomicrobiota bacterium]